MTQNLSRGERRFRLRVRANNDAQRVLDGTRPHRIRFWIGPVPFQMSQHRVVGKTGFARIRRQRFDFDLHFRQAGEARVQRLKCPGHQRPGGKARQRALRRARQAKGHRGTFAGGHERGEQVEFLRRHLREAVEPQAGESNFRFSIFNFRFAQQRGRGQIEQTVRVLQFVLIEPVEISPEQEGQIVQLVTQVSRKIDFARQRYELFRGMLVPLQFPQEQAELLRETRQPRCGPENVQLLLLLRQQHAQHHHPAFLVEQSGR